MKTYNFDYNRGVFVNAAGGVIGIVPELVYGEQAKWQLALKTASNTPYPLTGIASFTAAVGTVETIVAATNSGITFTASTGLVTVPLDCFTSEFQQVVAGQANGVFGAFELSGFAANGDKVLYLRFAVELRNEINTSGLSPSMEQKILETVSSGGYTTSGAVQQIAGSAVAENALPKNSSWTTTVGGYTITHDSNGVSIYGSGASATLSGGSVAVSAYRGFDLTYNNEDEGMVARVAAGFGGVNVYYNDTENETTLDIGGQGVTANGSALTQIESTVEETSLEIGLLIGGVKYVCQSALTTLSIGSAAAGCNGTIIFTAANGAIVTPPANVPYFGVTSYTAGSSYLMMINDFAAVCNEAAIVPGV